MKTKQLNNLLSVFTVSIIFGLALASCSKKEEVAASTSSADVYATACSNSEPPDLNTKIEITENTLKLTASDFTSTDASCTGDKQSYSVYATLERQGDSEVVEGAINVSITPTKYELTIYDKTQYDNSSKTAIAGCLGLGSFDDDLVEGVTYEVSNTECQMMGEVGATSYSLIKIDTSVTPNTLKFGKNDDAHPGTTVDNRPVELGNEVFTKE